jgi:uncharacterized protein (TIGR02001 family)
LFHPATGFAEFKATVTATTDYVWRWYSKSDNNFALQANIDYEYSAGFYAGASVSNVGFGYSDFKDPAKVEITPYLGWSYSISDDWRLDTQWTRYLYDGNIFGHQPDYNEFYLLLHYRDILTARASFAENYYDLGKATGNYELTGRYPVTDSLELSSSIGYSQTRAVVGADYPY